MQTRTPPSAVAQMQNSNAPITYLAFGDSTGVGVGAKNGGYVVRVFRKIEERRTGSKLVNLCVSGATTSDVVRDQLPRSIGTDPQLITIGIGINDIGHATPIQEFADNLDKILASLQSRTKAPIVISNIPDISSSPRVPESMRPQSQIIIQQFNSRLAEIATRHGVALLDIYSVTHDQLPRHPEYLSSDGFHPSDAGYDLWAQQMWLTVAHAVGVE